MQVRQEIQDRCHQWSTRPGPQHSLASSEYYFLLFCFARFEKWGQTDNMCENNDPYRQRLWVGRVDPLFSHFSAVDSLPMDLTDFRMYPMDMPVFLSCFMNPWFCNWAAEGRSAGSKAQHASTKSWKYWLKFRRAKTLESRLLRLLPPPPAAPVTLVELPTLAPTPESPGTSAENI